MNNAAAYLGIKPKNYGYSTTVSFHRWMDDHGPEQFIQALRELANNFDAVSSPLNYRRRRGALHRWSLTHEAWQEITDRLPPVPGPFQPNLDDRMRQEASAFIWAQVTCGEPLFAPRAIEEEQPEDLRRLWSSQRSSTWAKLARSRMNHYTALRGLLLQHSDTLSKQIDSGISPRSG
ncbi:hypothetical protein [Streptomyces sp. NPDC088910]|uniref:hypothetical protein n=1 Tax=Streptomyces sp. NPDC088910 TaxID=3365911 RepID=UPI00382E0642